MSKRVAYNAMLIALAMIFSYVEVLIPIHFGIPGMKLGVANLVIIIGLYFLKPQDVLLVSLIRIFLMGYLFGNGMSLLYSLAGGLLSFGVMLFLRKRKDLSIAGVSIAGGVSHNMGQLAVAAWVVQNRHVFYYAPALLVAGTVTGALIGVLAGKILPAVAPQGKKLTGNT